MGKTYPIYTTVAPQPTTVCQELDEAAFSFPFFNEGVLSAKSHTQKTYNLHSVNIPNETKSLELKGLIFHTSHCGSTLLSRMLSQINGVKIVSESEAINGLLLAKKLYSIKEDETINQLKKIIKLYQQKTLSDKHLIIKLTSWNVYLIKLFQQAFPEVKWIYLDRKNEDLIKSLKKSNGGFIDWWNHPVSVLREHFLDPRKKIKTKEEFLKEMTKGHRLHAKNNKNENSLFFEYPDFINNFDKILNHFNITATIGNINHSMEMLKYDSKSTNKKAWKNIKQT